MYVPCVPHTTRLLQIPINLGVPSFIIMAITGHRTETAFLKYIKVTLEEHAEKINEIWLNNANHLKVAQ